MASRRDRAEREDPDPDARLHGMSPSALRSLRSATVALVLLGAVRTAAQAQVTLVDEGTFSLHLGGSRIGREDFSIRAAPGLGGSAYVAQGNVLLGENRLSIALNADSSGLPLRVQLSVRQEGREVETISGEARRGVWMGRAVRADGESAREFRLPAGTIAAEEGVVHQWWFVIRGGARPLTLLSPRTLTLREVRLEDGGEDRVLLGLRELPARRWVVRDADGRLEREVWTDPQGRLLRLRVPAQELEALRDEPPPETPTR